MQGSKKDVRSETLRSAPLDMWIALSDDDTRIVATGRTYEAVAAELDRIGDDTAVILKTPARWLPLAV